MRFSAIPLFDFAGDCIECLLIHKIKKRTLFFNQYQNYFLVLNRKIAPPITTINRLDLPQHQKIMLSNNLPLYVLNMGTQEVVKLQIIFESGRPYEKKRLAAKTTCSQLKEGTYNHSSKAIAEKIDYYGATLSTPSNLDYSSIILYCLTKHLESLIPLLTDIIVNPIFPQEELDAYLENSKRRLQIDLTKNDVVAYRKITEFIFGSNHPYGYNSVNADFEKLSRNDLVQHFQQNYTTGNCHIFISGKINDATIKLLKTNLEQIPIGSKAILPNFELTKEPPQKRHIDIPNSVQTAIRIGMRSIGRNHPDFAGFSILSTILGGYFGSRLMTNIREDKGYTYNIYVTQDTMLYDNCFYVSTEVGNEFVVPTIKEIHKEFDRLQQDFVSDAELQMVRNYMLGNMLNMVDGPFHSMEVIRTLMMYKLPLDSFSQLIYTINQITPEQLRMLAQKYLNASEMWEVTAGS